MKTPDFATGKFVDATQPEEAVRQEYEEILVNDYGYMKNELDIEVSIPRGSGFFSDKADIVVYNSSGNIVPTSDILGIVETKAPGKDKEEGLQQLASYMTATSAIWGVWTNGEDIAYLYKKGSSIDFDYLNNIPARGQSIDDIGIIEKADLKPFGRQELKSAFRRILLTLYANSNISRREKLGNEMIKLIFAKIQDEKTYLSRPPEFRVQAGEDSEKVKERISNLFSDVVQDLAQDGVFSKNEEITLNARDVAWVVGQLERGSLLKTDSDVVGDAFEVFAESKLVGEKGEFFTPRGVIELAVKIVEPKPEHTICDPACGSGGFLIQAMRYIWEAMESSAKWKGLSEEIMTKEKERIASHSIYGIDKESDLVKIAKAYMAISGDGRSNIVHENSLHAPSDFNDSAKQKFVEAEKFIKFDHIFTNPPYGTKTRVLQRDAGNFELGYKWNYDKQTKMWKKGSKPIERDPYVLFVERCYDMLKTSGTLAIVLPETVFHAPSTEFLRHFISERFSIEGVISLPHNTFRPHCNAKTCLLILRKGIKQSNKVIMAAPEEMGHDHNGKTLHRKGTLDIWDDIAIVIEEIEDPDSPKNQFAFVANWSQIEKSGNWIPTYHRSMINPPPPPVGQQWIRVGDLVEKGVIGAWDGHGSPPAVEKGQGNIPYIRVSDIVNWEMYRNPVSGVSEEVYARMTKNKKVPEEGDVIFVRRGSYRIGTVAMASPRDKRVLLTRELVTFRIMQPNNEYSLTPYYLLALLSSNTVQEQISSKVFVDTTLPNIGDRWKDILLPVHEDKDIVKTISDKVESAVKKKWQAQEDIDNLGPIIGDLVT